MAGIPQHHCACDRRMEGPLRRIKATAPAPPSVGAVAWRNPGKHASAMAEVCSGWVAERLNATVLKTVEGGTLPWVRNPPHPPISQASACKQDCCNSPNREAWRTGVRLPSVPPSAHRDSPDRPDSKSKGRKYCLLCAPDGAVLDSTSRVLGWGSTRGDRRNRRKGYNCQRRHLRRSLRSLRADADRVASAGLHLPGNRN